MILILSICINEFDGQARSSIPTSNPTPKVETPQRAPEGKRWCVPKTGADIEALQRNIDYVCGMGFNCEAIQEGGSCFLPNTVRAHAAYAMNVYYQAMGRHDYACDFIQTGAVTDLDPST